MPLKRSLASRCSAIGRRACAIRRILLEARAYTRRTSASRAASFGLAGVAELVDALVLGTSDFGCASSSLAVGIPFPRLVLLVAAGNTGIFR